MRMAARTEDKPIRKYTKQERHDFLYWEPTRMKIAGINMTYEGLIPRIQRSMLSKDVDALQPHIRAFVERAVTFTTCPDCGGTRLSETARSSTIKGISIADACAMQVSDLAAWVRGLGEPSVAPLLAKLQQTLDARHRIRGPRGTAGAGMSYQSNESVKSVCGGPPTPSPPVPSVASNRSRRRRRLPATS